MPVILVARNTIGLGHIARSVALSEQLAEHGLAPLLIISGGHRFAIRHDIPSAAVNYRTFDISRQAFYKYIQNLALMSSPAVIVEDTIPEIPSLDSEVKRVLILRPPTFDAALGLNDNHGDIYDRIVVADHPDSPTWPYSLPETGKLMKLPNWHFGGPIYRKPDELAIDRLRKKYGAFPNGRICVFTMGGGGEHEGTDDARIFVERSTEIAMSLRRIDERAHLIFVKGPLFRSNISIPSVFKVVEQEREMPALIAAADTAVIRPGFNTTWECIAGGTPFLPIFGSSFQEPIPTRVARLQSAGCTLPDIASVWGSAECLAGHARAAQQLVANWPGRVPGAIIADCFSDLPRQKAERKEPVRALVLDARAPGAEPSVKELAESLRGENVEVEFTRASRSARGTLHLIGGRRPEDEHCAFFDPEFIITVGKDEILDETLIRPPWRFRRHISHSTTGETSSELIKSRDGVSPESSTQPDLRASSAFTKAALSVRIDDVGTFSPEFRELLLVFQDNGIPVSLEVVPYLCRFSDDELDSIDPTGTTIEVSQHGYCHLARKAAGTRKSEFVDATAGPLLEEGKDLTHGFSVLKNRFPKRFHGGFSPPYDSLPGWLAPFWLTLGGSYITMLQTRRLGARIPHLVMSIDPWDWNRNRFHSSGSIWNQAYEGGCRLGHAGIVLHHQHFTSKPALRWLDQMLSSLPDFSRRTLPSELVSLAADRIARSPLRRYHTNTSAGSAHD